MNNKPQKCIMKPDKAFVSNLHKNLKKYGSVKVTHLGIFEIRKIKSRISFDYATQSSIKTKPYKKIGFTATKKFKKYVQ